MKFRRIAPSWKVEGGAGAISGILASKRIYVLGVTNPLVPGPFNAPPCLTHVYNPANDSWQAGVSMSTNRVNLGIAVVNDIFYVVGGHTHT